MKKSIIFILLISLLLSIVTISNGNEVHAEATKTALKIEASPTAAKVLVNAKDKSFDAYNIHGNNYFKLRDLAFVLSGSKKQFEVKWDGNKRAINLISNKAYSPVGGEMLKGKGGKIVAKLNNDIIYKDGLEVKLLAYNISGNNYFKLRDIAKIFDIGLTWDGQTKTIGIDTSSSYIDPDNQENDVLPIAELYFSNEAGIKKYLEGEWIFHDSYTSDLTCNMKIDKDLNVKLAFHNNKTNSLKENYTGKIKFEKINVQAKDLPDAISIELKDSEWPGGDYYFLHRSIYDGKRVMSLFSAGNGNGIFDMLGDIDNFDYMLGEIIFEKTSGEISKLPPRKNNKFHAVYWGKGKDGKSLWLDDVIWTPKNEEYATIYPWEMTAYENDIRESVLYTIVASELKDILGDDLFPGQVYYVESDEQGRIKHFISAERKRFLEESQEGFIDIKDKNLIFNIIQEIVEIKEYLNLGMEVLITGETTIIDGQECYELSLGTNHEEGFVREIHYAVNIITWQVYRLDILNNKWESLGLG